MNKDITVIKLGGSSLSDPSVVVNLAALIKSELAQQKLVVVVHGGGPAINAALTARAITWNFINGQRVTTLDMIATIEDVLKTEINGLIVNTLQTLSVPAVGLSGNQNGILLCIPANPELQYVGQVTAVNVGEILKVLGAGVPIIAPLGVDVEGQTYNINADFAAAQIAIALKAKELIYLTDQKGIWDENKNIISSIDAEGLQQLIDSKTVVGGMLAKTQTIIKALTSGIKNVRIQNASDILQIIGDPNLGTHCALKNKDEAINASV